MKLFKNKQNIVDELLNKYIPTNDFNSLRNELNNLNYNKLSIKEKEDWYYIKGIIEFRTNNRPAAFNLFKEGLSLFPNSSAMSFSLGQEYEYIGQIDNALLHFNNVNLEQVGGATIMAITRYLYLWSKYKEATKFLDQIFDAYFKLGIIDDNFLYIRGLPFFSEAFDYFILFSMLNNNYSEVDKLFEKCKALNEYDFKLLEIEIEAYKTNNFIPLINEINSLITNYPDMPHGTHKMRVASLLVNSIDNITDALKTIDDVILSENDFRWLDDIKIIKKAEIYNKFKLIEEENVCLKAFYKNQPLLFEPNHVVNYNLIIYQEKLKKHYIKSRIGGTGG